MQLKDVYFGSLILCTMALFMCTDCTQQTAPQRDELAGTWRGHLADQENVQVTLTVADGRMEISGLLSAEGSYEENTETDPKRFILSIENNPNSQAQGKQIHGIYKIENGQLTLAFNGPHETEPPQSFASGEATGILLLTRE